MTRTRTFVAVSVSPAVISKIQDIVRELSRGVEGVKWVAPENLHFTLKFLGDVEDTALHDICRAVSTAAEGISPFEVLVAGAGAFPSAKRPRTLWVGVSHGSDEFIKLQKKVDKGLRSLGHQSESRRFTPHVTIGRVREGNQTLALLTEHLKAHVATELGPVSVGEALVFSSELRPGGPEYHVLGRAPLGGGSSDRP